MSIINVVEIVKVIEINSCTIETKFFYPRNPTLAKTPSNFLGEIILQQGLQNQHFFLEICANIQVKIPFKL